MTQQRIQATNLATKLAEGLSDVVPSVMEVSLAGPVVSLGVRGRRAGMAADQFQDEVAETIAEPWPAVSPGPMPEAFAEIRDGRLIAGYGDPACPALRVLSVALHDLR